MNTKRFSKKEISYLFSAPLITFLIGIMLGISKHYKENVSNISNFIILFVIILVIINIIVLIYVSKQFYPVLTPIITYIIGALLSLILYPKSSGGREFIHSNFVIATLGFIALIFTSLFIYFSYEIPEIFLTISWDPRLLSIIFAIIFAGLSVFYKLTG